MSIEFQFGSWERLRVMKLRVVCRAIHYFIKTCRKVDFLISRDAITDAIIFCGQDDHRTPECTLQVCRVRHCNALNVHHVHQNVHQSGRTDTTQSIKKLNTEKETSVPPHRNPFRILCMFLFLNTSQAALQTLMNTIPKRDNTFCNKHKNRWVLILFMFSKCKIEIPLRSVEFWRSKAVLFFSFSTDQVYPRRMKKYTFDGNTHA